MRQAFVDDFRQLLLFTGVMRHVGAALAEKSIKRRKKHIAAIGIAPWGVVHRRAELIGRDVRNTTPTIMTPVL